MLFNDMEMEQTNKDRQITLKLNYTSKYFSTNYNTDAFDKQLIYYLIYPDENISLLRTFVLVDFKKGIKHFYNLYSPENLEKIREIPKESLSKEAHEPHHALHTKRGEIFLFMYKNGNFLYHLDLNNLTAKIITLEDLGLNHLTRLGDTFFIDSDNIYISGYMVSEENFKTKLFKSDTELCNIEEIGEYEISWPRAPHTTLHHKGLLMNVHMMDSELVVYNTFKNKPERYHTSGSVAGHIERSGDYIYVSNHNFKRSSSGNGLEFMAPAYIDKFLIKNQKLIHKGCFMDRRGFRYTSHKIFRYKGKEYIVTVGQPNRLFVINTSDMSIAHYDVIGKDVFPKEEDPKEYINNNQFKMKDMIRPVEVSCNGEYIVLISSSLIILYNFAETKISKIIRIKDDIKMDPNINLKHYKLNTSHTNFI